MQRNDLTAFVCLITAEEDLSTVISEILEVRAKYSQLGISLGIRSGDMDAIAEGSFGNVDSAFRKVIQTWLKQDYSVQKHGKPSWRKLLKCVGSPAGGANNALAMRVADRHKGITFILSSLISIKNKGLYYECI
jgi:hypothetical protein